MEEVTALTDKTEKDWEGYYNYRSQLEQLRVQQITAFDSAIVNLTSGALGLSVIILTAFGALTTPIHLHILFSSWACFVLTIIANLISYQTGARSMTAEMEEQDALMREEDFKPKKQWANATYWLNRFVIVAFPIGAVLLLTFAALNATAVKASEQPNLSEMARPATLESAAPITKDTGSAPSGTVPTGLTPSGPPARPTPIVIPIPALGGVPNATPQTK